jgi:hypothetical protein
MLKGLAALAGLVFVLAAGQAQAAPTGECLWTGLTAQERAGFSQLVTSHARMTDGSPLQAAAVRVLTRCGFEHARSGETRGSFLISLMVYRSRVEQAFQTNVHITPATLSQTYATLPPAFHAQLIALARAHYSNQPVVNPDPAQVEAVATRLHLAQPQARQALVSYLLIRSTAEFVQALGPAFSPPAAPATAH